MAAKNAENAKWGKGGIALYPILFYAFFAYFAAIPPSSPSIDDNIAAQRLQTDFVGAFVEAAVELTLVLVDAAL